VSAYPLVATSITLAYDRRIVTESLDLTIAPGQITAIVGPNGCGKSTLLRALARLLAPRAGTVTVNGSDLYRTPPKQVARTIGLLPQHPSAPEGISAADLVGRGRHPHQRAFTAWSHDDHQAVAEALELTTTCDLADRPIDELSGGQRQRVWIAMALAQRTDILLLDEPTSFLDVAHQIEVLDLLTDLNHRRSTTIVMVLHDLNLAARYADELVVMHAGQIHTRGKPAAVVTAQLVRDVFDLDCEVITDPVCGAPHVIPAGRHHRTIQQPAIGERR
jgi:iron complex transport system ATP-binding protein